MLAEMPQLPSCFELPLQTSLYAYNEIKNQKADLLHINNILHNEYHHTDFSSQNSYSAISTYLEKAKYVSLDKTKVN